MAKLKVATNDGYVVKTRRSIRMNYLYFYASRVDMTLWFYYKRPRKSIYNKKKNITSLAPSYRGYFTIENGFLSVLQVLFFTSSPTFLRNDNNTYR